MVPSVVDYWPLSLEQTAEPAGWLDLPSRGLAVERILVLGRKHGLL